MGPFPLGCVDCHNPKSMELRVTRPGFLRGIRALADSTRQEMRSFVCGQCHVEYYCGPKATLFFPWGNGLRVEQIERTYDAVRFDDGHRFYDWKHAETGAEVLKAQHPEFELWSQGIHARSGVACADCHMSYKREGAMKLSDHWVRSPLLNVARACQVCHAYPEAEIQARVDAVQTRTRDLLERSATALVDMLDAIVVAKGAGASDQQLAPVLELQRQAQLAARGVVAVGSGTGR